MSGLPFDPALAWENLPAMLDGLLTTILITIAVLVPGLLLAVLIALARMSRRRLLAWPAAVFVVFFRGTPLLILLYLVYYGFGQIQVLRDGPLWVIFGNAFACAVIALTLNHVAFLVDIVRGAVQAVPAGLTEASAALGISRRDTFRWIQLPLAARYGMKAYQNEVIMFTKATAVISVVTIVDLTAVANEVFELTYDPFTPMLTAALLYWLLVNVIRQVFRLIDLRLNRHIAVHETRAASRDAGPQAATASAPPRPARFAAIRGIGRRGKEAAF